MATRVRNLGVVLLMLPATNGNGQAPAPGAARDLGGTAWHLVQFLGSGDKTLVPDDTGKYTIAFDGKGGVNVRIDCNRGRGTWKSAGPNQVEFGPLAMTRAMCPAAPLTDQLPKDWESVRSYTLKDGHLFLSLKAEGGSYEFERDSAGGATVSLENTYWKLSVVGDTSVPAASEQKEAHIVLYSENHRVSGSGGCNRISGSYEVNGDQLKFGQMASTMMACLQGKEIEKGFLKAMGQAKTWRIDGEELELVDADGKVVARLEARPMK